MKKWKNLDRLILTDCDGVCLDWEWAFNVWMQEHGFEEIAGSKLQYDMSIRYNVSKDQIRKLIKVFNECGHWLSCRHSVMPCTTSNVCMKNMDSDSMP
jgi:hypothetical protein